MADSTSLYMCSLCQQLFASLENVLAHHLTCHIAAHNSNIAPSAQVSSELNPAHSKSPTSSAAEPSLQPSNQGAKSTPLTSSSTNQTQKASSVPLIRYQCGECSALFVSLDQWQQHSKLGFCCVGSLETKEGVVEEVIPEASEKQNEECPEKQNTARGGSCETKNLEEGMVTKVEKVDRLTTKANAQESHQTVEPSDCGAMNRSESSKLHEEPGKQPNKYCEIPGLAFGTSGLTPADTFLCTHCGSGFNTEEALAAHRSSNHGLERMLHCCIICSQEFMSTTQYLYHRRQHKAKVEGLPGPVAQNHVSGTLSKITGNARLSQAPAVTLTEQLASIPESAKPFSVLPLTSNPTPFPPSPATEKHCRALCPICGQVFRRRCHLRVHMLCHSGQKPHCCEVCNKTFAYKSNLGRHRQTHSTRRALLCQQCGQSFGQSGILKKHQQLHELKQLAMEGGGDGELEESKKRMDESEGKVVIARTMFSCSDCSNRYSTRTQLLVHRFVHTGQYPFSCSICGDTFPRRKSLQLHSLIHQGKQPVTCPTCSDQFPDQNSLDTHRPLCKLKERRGGEVDTSVLGMAKKNTSRGAKRIGKLICDLCGHRCVTQEGLDLHRLSHSGQTPLRCPLLPCKRRFTSNSALEEHMLSHGSMTTKPEAVGADTKPRPHHCRHCEKGFTTASSLNVHLRIHTGERPFQCGQCGKRFRQIPHLRDHERLHMGTKPFVCSVCDRSFLLAARLAEHARTHSGEKPYQCPVCHRAFRSLSNLGKHRKTHGLIVGSEPNTATVELASAAQQPRVGSESTGSAALHTILLVQTPETGPRDTCPNSAHNATTSPPPLVFLQPVVEEEEQEVLANVFHHAIEVVVTENSE
ncbi:oocyte zinc finger protein XlCOF6-like isoform X2 [Hoplias malabaricus]|uniref:oocyte zinc finger protein XlCOF6-like isoform X2 n=1 Tax=Hoplias malabaricus TaxID=27720 RepID=UPI0034633C70